jgi:ketosteroid isomerase-like protein
MASANLELVRSMYAAWERGDYSSTDWAHPEIEFVIADGPQPARWTGMTGMAEGWTGFLNAWENWRTWADEYLELDGDRVLVLAHYSGRGKASGLELAEVYTQGGASLSHIRDGKVVRLIVWFEREHALADLGIASEPGPR